MAKFDIKTVKPKFVVTTSPENKIDVVVNKPIIETKLSKSFFKLKNTGGPRGQRGPQGEPGVPGRDGQDGDAATIQVGQVETLEPNQQAYVQNVGTTSAAIFNIGIPKGDKGDSGSGSGDMTASTYDPNGTVASAGGIPDYVSSQLPTVNDATLTIQKNGTTVQTFTANQGSNATANITVPTDTSDLTNGAGYITSSSLPSDMTGATSSTAGAHGLVPAPAAGDQDKVLKGDGTWGDAAATAIVAYINGAYGGSWTSSFQVYTTSAHTTVCPFQDIDDSIKAGVAVIFRTTDNYDITITGLLGAVSTTHYYTAQYDGYTLGTLTYSETNSRWAYVAGTPINDATLTIQHNGTTVQTFTANSSANKTANVETIYADAIQSTSALTPPVQTNMIANGAVTSDKLDWSTLNYMPGDTLTINDDNFNLSGRLWISGSNKYALCALPLDKKIDSGVTSITFTQTNYLNIYGGSSLIFSQNTSSSIVWTVTKSATVSNTLLFKIQLPSATSITSNTCCSLDFKGIITFA